MTRKLNCRDFLIRERRALARGAEESGKGLQRAQQVQALRDECKCIHPRQLSYASRACPCFLFVPQWRLQVPHLAVGVNSECGTLLQRN